MRCAGRKQAYKLVCAGQAFAQCGLTRGQMASLPSWVKSGATRLGALCCMKPREMHWKSSTTIGLSTPHRMKPFEMRWKSGATIGSGADDHKADDEAE